MEVQRVSVYECESQTAYRRQVRSALSAFDVKGLGQILGIHKDKKELTKRTR